MARSAVKIIISHTIGFLIFLILLAIANALIPTMNSNIYTYIVKFFNDIIILIILLFLLGLINEIFWSFYFPFNIFAPITGAILSVVVIMFLENLWYFADIYINSNIEIPFILIYIFVPIIVIIAGYLTIIVRRGKPREEWHEKQKEKIDMHKEKIKKHIKELNKEVKNIDWEDVSNEYKEALYNLGKSINNFFEEKQRKDKGEKKIKIRKKGKIR